MNTSEQSAQACWRAQPAGLPRLSIEELQHAATGLQRRVARRNRREVAAGLVVMLAFGGYIGFFRDEVIRLGAALVILGTIVVLWQLHVRAAARALPADFGVAGLGFQRAELARQRDALHQAWWWYLGPPLPGLAVFMWGVQRAAGGLVPWIIDLAMVAVLVLVAWANRRVAARLQSQISALDAMSEPPHDD